MTINKEELQEILNRLKANDTTLTSLRLRWNYISPEGGASIGKALESNTSLTSLDLAENNIRDKGGVAIGKGLESNASLSKLDLTNSIIGPEGGAAIGKALESNTSLTILFLRDNHINFEGGAAIGKALERNASLTSLDLAANNIGAKGGAAIGKGLEINASLTLLYLSQNDIGAEGASAIEQALRKNFTLLEIQGVVLSKEAIELLERNKRLRLAGLLKKARLALEVSFNSIEEKIEEIKISSIEEYEWAPGESESYQAIPIPEAVFQTLNKSIEELRAAQERLQKEMVENKDDSSGSQHIFAKLKALEDRCAFRIAQLKIEYFRKNAKTQEVIDEFLFLEESSIFFSYVRIEAFATAYNQYVSEKPSKLHALVQTLPLLEKEDNSLLINFSPLSEEIKKEFELAQGEQYAFFDFLLQEIVAGKGLGEQKNTLQPSERLALLQLALLRYLKEFSSREGLKERKAEMTPISFFSQASSNKPSLKNLLSELPKGFDAQDKPQRQEMDTRFKQICEALEDFSWNKLEANETTGDLKRCKDLMNALQKTRDLHPFKEEPEVSDETKIGKGLIAP